MAFTLAALSQTVKDIKAQVRVIRTVPLLDWTQMEIQANHLPVNYLNPKVSQAQAVEEKKIASILLVHTLTKKRKPPNAQTLMRDLQVTQNPSVIQDTRHRAHPGQIAGGHVQGHGQGHEGLELVHLTPDWTDPGETEAPALNGHITMTLTEDRTGHLHAEREGAPVHTLIETERVLIQRTSAGKQGQGRVNQANRLLIQVLIKIIDPLLM